MATHLLADSAASPDKPSFPRSARYASAWSASRLALAVAAAGLLGLLAILHGFVHRDAGPDGCAVPGMRPSYVRLRGFDAEHTRFAAKYSLFLYREEGLDPYTDDDIGVSLSSFFFLISIPYLSLP
jgi:GPI inositol-deacylase